MFLDDRVSFIEELRPVFLEISQAALLIRNNAKKFRLYEYAELAEMYGEVEDWKCEGRIRRAMYGRDGRRWLRRHFKLWWKADEAQHSGLLFTADPRTGVEWRRRQIADRTYRDGLELVECCEYAIEVNPMFRDDYQLTRDRGKRLVGVGEGLKKLSDPERLKLLGVSSEADE